MSDGEWTVREMSEPCSPWSTIVPRLPRRRYAVLSDDEIEIAEAERKTSREQDQAIADRLPAVPRDFRAAPDSHQVWPPVPRPFPRSRINSRGTGFWYLGGLCRLSAYHRRTSETD